MRLHAWNIVLEQENMDKKVILERRKHSLSRKRQVINEKYLMIRAVDVREAEEVIKQRKMAQKDKQRRNIRSKVKKESNDESEIDSYITNDEEVE